MQSSECVRDANFDTRIFPHRIAARSPTLLEPQTAEGSSACAALAAATLEAPCSGSCLGFHSEVGTVLRLQVTRMHRPKRHLPAKFNRSIVWAKADSVGAAERV